MSEQEEQQQTVVTEPQPVVAEPLTEKTPEEEKKAKRLEQLKAARIAKKEKKQQKEREDAEVRAALLRLTEENASLKRKREPEPEPEPKTKPEPAPEPEPEVVKQPPQNKRVRVTRSPPSPPTQKEQPSFIQQVAITGIVGALGLASWYTQNRLFQEKKPSGPKNNISGQKKQIQKTKTKTKTPPGPSLFQPTRSSKVVGKSGFTL